MQINIQHAGRYAYKQSRSQTTQAWFLSLVVSGLNKSRYFFSDGSFFFEGKNRSLHLVPPGIRIDFDFSAERENFVVIFDSDALSFDPPVVNLDTRSTQLRLEPQILLSSEETYRYRGIFERIIELKNTPLPANLFLAEQLCRTIIGEIALPGNSTPESAGKNNSASEVLAAKLKVLLDEDISFRYSLAEHCRMLGRSAAYARRCFFSTYGIDPQEYRLRRRMERILMLLDTREYTNKEIADMVGMKNVTHLHMFIRRRCGTTPAGLKRSMPR